MILSGPGKVVPHVAGSVMIVVFGHAGSDPGTPGVTPGQSVTPMVMHKVVLVLECI